MNASIGTADIGAMIADTDFVEITEADGVRIDIRCASTNNFLGRNLYGSFDRFLLHRIAADKLLRAVDLLAAEKPGLRLLLLDGLRPNRIQHVFWEAVRGTPQQIYVGDPEIGSIHGFGLAVDLSLVDEHGRELDMGTPFDGFTALVEPRLEAEFLASGALSASQIDNRLLLRKVMTQAGFHVLPIEWWHFDALPSDQVRGRFSLIV